MKDLPNFNFTVPVFDFKMNMSTTIFYYKHYHSFQITDHLIKCMHIFSLCVTSAIFFKTLTVNTVKSFLPHDALCY